LRIASLDHYRLSYGRVVGLAAAVGLSGAIFTFILTSTILGGVSALVSAALGIGFAYLVATTPKRNLERSALIQAREAPVLAASATVHLQTTGSRSKTLLALRSESDELEEYLDSIRRRIILGHDASSAVREKGSGIGPSSLSVKRILESVADFSNSRITADSVELEGMRSSSALREETKVPVFVAVTFFTPIMMLLFAGLTGNSGLLQMLSLTVLQVAVLELAYAITSAEKEILES
jgi:hypothetical protein